MAEFSSALKTASKESKSKAMLFALPRFGTSIFIGIADFSLLFLYGTAYQLDGLLVGLSLMFGKLSIALSQFLFGWISDHTYTKLGRRKPYILIMTPILTFSFILLILPGMFIGPGASQYSLFIWFAVWNSIFQASYAVTTPYQAWLAELFEVKERPLVSAYQNIFNFLGTATMTVFSFVVLTHTKEALLADPNHVPPELLYSTIVFGIILIVLFYLAALKLPVEKTPRYETKLIETLKRVVHNKNFILVTLLQGIASFAWSISQSQVLNLTENVMGLSTMEFIIIAGLMIIFLIIGIFYWVKSIGRIGKKNTLLRVFIMGIIVMPFSLVGFIRMSNFLIFGVIFISLVAICIGGWYLYPYLIYADIAEDDEKKSGEMNAGLYTGFPSIFLNIFQAVGLLISGWLLELPTYNFTGGNYTIGYVVWGPIASIILVFAYLYAKHLIKLDFDWERKED
ncbi:MAG: MFS transporter [Promethearchaeota archaeon]